MHVGRYNKLILLFCVRVILEVFLVFSMADYHVPGIGDNR